MAYKTEQEALEAVLATVKEIEGLAKSMAPLKKDEEEGSPADKVEDQAEAAGQPEAAPAPEMGAPAPEGEVAPEGDPGQEGAPEGEDFDPSSLSDEELHAILEMLTAELQKREAGQSPDAGMAPPAAPGAPAPAPAAGPAVPPPAPAMAPPMEDENKALAMSFKMELEKMAKSQAALVKEIEALKKSRSMPVSRPAATNATSVSKVEVQAERLNKSESIEKLLTEQRTGNKKVNSSLVADMNCVCSEEELKAAQDHVSKMSGVKFTR